MMNKILAIVGSRSCPTLDIASFLPFIPTTIVSGGAKGADTLAKGYARDNNIPLTEYLPNYKAYGRQAPILRNIQIVENCDFLIAFWDGISRGTKFTIDYARKRGVPLQVFNI